MNSGSSNSNSGVGLRDPFSGTSQAAMLPLIISLSLSSSVARHSGSVSSLPIEEDPADPDTDAGTILDGST
jgi:hypothetical protein